MTAAFTVAENTKERRRRKSWVVVDAEGRALDYEGKIDRHGFAAAYDTRRDAVEHAAKFTGWAERRERIMREDWAGIAWTPEEQQQIEEYAVVLRANETHWTFYGEETCRESAARQHASDARDLESTNWTDCEYFHAEKRRVRAARAEAWRRAGLGEL